MKCPHCLENFHTEYKITFLKKDKIGAWQIEKTHCPSCDKYIFYLSFGNLILKNLQNGSRIPYVKPIRRMLVWPKGISRAPLPNEVPEKFAKDYKEACLVLLDSSKASAALSRRCLQNLLREIANVKHSDLANEIQQVIDTRNLPSHLSEAIDAVRNIGNFAAHPIKSKNSGEIIPVEKGEAEWNLDVLESLFDFYFVAPTKLKIKKDKLNKKLKEAGKKDMK